MNVMYEHHDLFFRTKEDFSPSLSTSLSTASTLQESFPSCPTRSNACCYS